MAGDELARSEFTSILARIERNFDIVHTKWSEDGQHFEAKAKTQIARDSDDYNGLCDQWVDLFSTITGTTWVKKISNTGPKIKFRKQYQCWTHPGKVQKELLFDARRCKATLDLKVLADNPQARRRNKNFKLGLNVVVKINFNHLHKVDTAKPFAFFVHQCEPQSEAPKPVIHPNDRLPKLIADIVEKGRSRMQKSLEEQQQQQQQVELHQDFQQQQQHDENCVSAIVVSEKLPDCHQVTCETTQLQVQHVEHLNMIQLNPLVPLQSMDTIKLQLQPNQQLTQVVVSAPQLDINESLLMCQPATLMFEPSQVIPVSAHSLPHHYVQVHSHNLPSNEDNAYS